MKTMPVPPGLGRATCSDPQHLPLVDAAAAKPGGPEAQEMKDRLCRQCPVREACAAWAIAHPEIGVWGGTTPKQRTHRGAPSAARKPNPHRHREPTANEVRVAELGVRERDIKHWAYEQGLIPTLNGRVSLALVEAWAAAHTTAA